MNAGSLRCPCVDSHTGRANVIWAPRSDSDQCGQLFPGLVVRESRIFWNPGPEARAKAEVFCPGDGGAFLPASRTLARRKGFEEASHLADQGGTRFAAKSSQTTFNYGAL